MGIAAVVPYSWKKRDRRVIHAHSRSLTLPSCEWRSEHVAMANTMTNPERPATIHIALSTIVPFIMGLCATWVTMVIGEQYGWDTMPFVLVGWCVALGLSAAWLNRVVFRRTTTVFPLLSALAVILLIWLWQRQAFTMFVPRSGLTYGYFLRPEGAKARFWT